MSISFNRRTKVLLALLISMTLGSAVLLAMFPDRPAGAPPTVLASAQRSADYLRVNVPAGLWRGLAVHESGGEAADLAELDRRDAADGGCAYHFVVRPDGRVQASRRWLQQRSAPARAGDGSQPVIHVLLAGQAAGRPTPSAQAAALDRLIAQLCDRTGLTRQPIVLLRPM